MMDPQHVAFSGVIPRHTKTLNAIARVYDLVEELREVIKELHEVNVEVKIARYSSSSDPLGIAARIMVTMNPGCELIDK